jgi:hypothetical protein
MTANIEREVTGKEAAFGLVEAISCRKQSL